MENGSKELCRSTVSTLQIVKHLGHVALYRGRRVKTAPLPAEKLDRTLGMSNDPLHDVKNGETKGQSRQLSNS